jgi:hypothetical protein
MANVLSNLQPSGVYWNSKACNDINFSEDATWERIVSVEDITEDVINNIKSIGIITFYGENGDAERASFAFTINRGEWVSEKYDENKNYGSVYQWSYFLAYKDIIGPLFEKLGIKYPDTFNIWTNTSYNTGGLDGLNAVQWMVDLKYNTTRMNFKHDEGYGIEVYNVTGNRLQNIPNTPIGIFNAKLNHGVYYCEQHPNRSDAIFYRVSENSIFENTVTPKYLVFNTISKNDVERKPFWIQIEKNNDIEKGVWDESRSILTKYQWDIFFAHKDLVDKVYAYLNKDKEIGTLDIYGISNFVWTSTDYVVKKNTLGYYEVNSKNGKGIKWVVCPSLRTSQIMFRSKTVCNYPKVGLWE